MKVLRFATAVFVGIMTGSLVIWAVQMLAHNFYPPPTKPESPEAIAEMLANAPLGALLMVILAYAMGSFAGGIVAQLIYRCPRQIDSLTTGAILMVFGIMNFLAIPHPQWMAILGVAVFVPFAWVGGRLVQKKPTAP